MHIFSNKFEMTWAAIFVGLFVLIMMPLSFYYSETYIPGPWGIPTYIFGWLIHAVVVFVLIFIFAAQALSRPEYHDYDKEREE